LPIRLGQNLFALQTAENSAARQTDFAADKEHSDDEVVWDESEEDDEAGSNAATEGSSATHGDDGSEELEDSGEPLSHSRKFLGPSSLRDWFEDDDEPGSAIALGGVALYVATAAATGAQAILIMDLPASPEQPHVALEPAASKPDDPEGAGSRATGAKRGIQPASAEPAEKRKKAEPAAKSLLPPRIKKVIKRRATAVAG
jgi:hypothetical protein